MAIGALVRTAEHGPTGNVIQTDADGLDMLYSHAETAMDAIYAALEDLGKLLVYSDTAQVSESGLDGLGWLLVSFGELGLQLQDARSLIEENIRRLHENDAERTPEESAAQTGEVDTED